MAQNNQKLTQKELTGLWNRYMWFYNSQGNYARFHGVGYAFSLIPFFKKYYDREGQIEGLKRQSGFLNTEMQLGSLLFGIVVGLEEERALGKDVSDEVITSTKTSLMGPIAGIGDSMISGVIIPILLAIAMAISANGSILGPLFYILAYLALIVFGSRYLFFKGHDLGVNAVNLIMGEQSRQICDAISLIGVIVMGAIAAGNINLALNIQLADVSLQGVLDGIYPKLLPLGIVLGSWAALKKTKITTMGLIGILAAASFIFAAIGII